ncbi:MAG: pyridoxamine kinase [Clostridia bacterium]|nr:pyridoxamine kinase [Clostridia bacterium]
MKRILTVQDISCVGRCSLTVALPIISAAGVEAAILPTAVLSTHTQFSSFTFCDLTPEIEKISLEFDKHGLTFDAIYTGYLGSFEQLSLVSELFDRNRGEGCKIVIDPVMADNGVLYKGFTEEFAGEMAKLCTKADLIIPNLTEASFMLGVPYNPNYDEAYIRSLLKSLCSLGTKEAAISGISFDKSKLGVYSYNSETDEYFYYCNDYLPVAYHGTGDIFASSVVGALMRGHSTASALKCAVDFTLECIKATMADEDRRVYGVNFEQALAYYISRLENKD